MSAPAGKPMDTAGGGVLYDHAPMRELADFEALLATTKAQVVSALCIRTQDAEAGTRALRHALRLFDERLAGWAADALAHDRVGITAKAVDELEAMMAASRGPSS